MTFLTPELMKGTDWFGLERVVGRLMSHCGWQDVRIVGSAGDGGADVLAIRRQENGQRVFVVQVKAVTGGNYIGPAAIEEVVSAISTYGGDVGVVATNGEFTQSARKRRDALRMAGFKIELWNGTFLKGLLQQWPATHCERRELRPFQERILGRCLDQFHSGTPKALFVVATGLGKSVIAAELIAKLREEGLSTALVLCHSQDLATQLEQAFWTQLAKDTPTRLFYDGEPPKPYNGVNFGLYQTFVTYLSGIDPEDFDVLVVDEAHHALALGFKRSIRHLRPKLLIGMTATPWRGDGGNIEEIFGRPVGAVSLVDGMKMGFLAEVDYRIFIDTIDWRGVEKLTRGAMSVKDLNTRLFLPQRDEAIIDEIVGVCETLPAPRVLVFCPSIEHARRFASLMIGRSRLECRQVSGLDKVARNKALMEFAAGRVQVVTAVDVLNEGIDIPDVNVLVFLRSTHSRRIFVQQLGRGLRLSPGKSRVVVLDFVTDIRRIVAAMEMDREARESGTPYQIVHFPQGIVRFSKPELIPFVRQWLSDIAGLEENEDAQDLQFPK